MISFPAKIKLIFAIRCDEASQLASDALDRPLAWYERWALRGHVLVCWSCRRFRKQIAFLSAAMRRIEDQSNEPDESMRLTDDAKARLKALMMGGDGEP